MKRNSEIKKRTTVNCVMVMLPETSTCLSYIKHGQRQQLSSFHLLLTWDKINDRVIKCPEVGDNPWSYLALFSVLGLFWTKYGKTLTIRRLLAGSRRSTKVHAQTARVRKSRSRGNLPRPSGGTDVNTPEILVSQIVPSLCKKKAVCKYKRRR